MFGAAIGDGAALLLVGVFLAVAAVEFALPGRAPSGPAGRRWFGNLSLHLVSAAVVAVPVWTGLAAALAAEAAQIGLLNRLDPPAPVRLAAGVLGLDLLAYWLHRLHHRVGVLWRLHAVHHTDPDLDVTTHLRHHPGAVLVEAVVTGGAVLLAGLSPAEVALYAALAWTVQAVAHANIALPPRSASAVGSVLVTPAIHRLHHSRDAAQTDSNYGQVFAFWDRLFGTATRPRTGDRIEFGLDEFRDAAAQVPHRLLAQPLLRRPREAERAGASPPG